MTEDKTKHWISFSGGLGSAVSAIVAKLHGYNFEMIMADTLIEDEDLWRFVNDVSEAVEKEVIVLRTGKTPWDVMRDKKWIGNTRTAHCSEELKTAPIRRFLDEYARPEEPLVLGMGWSEMDRIERASTRWSPRPVKSLLVEHRIDNAAVDSLLAAFFLEKPRLYSMGFPHNNCGGFCVKAGLKQFATLLEQMPDRYAAHEKKMAETMEAIGPTARPFLRKTVGKKLNYLTLEEFREGYEKGEINVSPYDYGGCGCFTD